MESAGNRTNIMILDACRNNPFTARTRSASRGLARVDAPAGSFLAYATAPGSVADDGEGENSPFSRALARLLPTPGLPIEQVFKQVRIEVIEATGGAQTPWDSSSLVEDFYFKPGAPDHESRPVELSLWQSVSTSADAGRIALFLQVYPNSRFAPEARALLAGLIADKPDLVAASGASAPIPKPGAPAASEHDMIAAAQASGLAGDYERYLAAYPVGTFADLARAELAHLRSTAPQSATQSTTQSTTPGAEASLAPTSAPAMVDGSAGALVFDSPLASSMPEIAGRTLHELARGAPMFPPVDGLDEEYWRDQPCSNCHNWTRENLCEQGKFYVGKDDEVFERLRHPYGGDFRLALRTWSAAGCR